MKSIVLTIYVSIALVAYPVVPLKASPTFPWWLLELVKVLADNLGGGTECANQYQDSAESHVLLCDCETYVDGVATNWTICP